MKDPQPGQVWEVLLSRGHYAVLLVLEHSDDSRYRHVCLILASDDETDFPSQNVDSWALNDTDNMKRIA